ncbi:hypothetical protein [Acidianus brierleyi]|uniref:Uncharacterized protein n=1 Tax=Acidianus brierleyi TaxID=41673 RepID=A0A2U9IGW8_9CREN|nr:hypothetical protein [Acidianus brierleyi]AWR95298.1 hypothetical protein DFR85_12535 [Acidianus brierleyi]
MSISQSKKTFIEFLKDVFSKHPEDWFSEAKFLYPQDNPEIEIKISSVNFSLTSPESVKEIVTKLKDVTGLEPKAYDIEVKMQLKYLKDSSKMVINSVQKCVVVSIKNDNDEKTWYTLFQWKNSLTSLLTDPNILVRVSQFFDDKNLVSIYVFLLNNPFQNIV